MTTEERNTLDTAINAVLAKRTSAAPTNVAQPFMAGDVLTFALAEGETADSLVVYHAPQVQANGNTINEYIAIRTKDGRELSQTQLCRRQGNGLNLEGETPDDRLRNFLALVQERRTLQIKIADSRVLPSTNPQWNGTRVITWEPIR